jgi:hypothetical protein
MLFVMSPELTNIRFASFNNESQSNYTTDMKFAAMAKK